MIMSVLFKCHEFHQIFQMLLIVHCQPTGYLLQACSLSLAEDIVPTGVVVTLLVVDAISLIYTPRVEPITWCTSLTAH